ncbi:GlsB/YeaQ/YmgE family stress response membrane protein [Sandaracinus amylolyticus]|uniref:Transglycosylase associated protein n=1 Tax=Sandaracinus amylolyticus TaxID=927083 RepID=A0A0F6SHN1_9BACT|nr:GlsB/YeaQ/YmgE family stress response membrane protein [Sandaracinus amylolyticus]AKF10734.1 hypothetical protein DB32_007883 [Sandaracinus amylolyticus]
MLITILTWIVFGLVVGFIARAVVPGSQPMSIPGTILLGVAGSFVGGLVGNLLAGNTALQVHAAGFIGSVLGAILLLVLMMFATRRRLA